MKMKSLILIAAIALFQMLTINAVNADECYRIERQLSYAESMLRRGGNSSYMKLWRQSRDHNHEELQKCKRRFGKGDPQITVYSGTGNSDPQHYREHIHSNINNPQLQSLIKTCNYWIDEVNRNSSPENLAFRANACRDARTAEIRILNPPKTFVMVHKRSAKECIKPNQVIDNEVKECMEGLREPSWITSK